MSETPATRDCGADVAAYALGALEPAEAEAFARHLRQCSVCRDELTAFQQAVNALPMAAQQYRAPDSLRRRVLAVAGSEPKAQPAAERRRVHPRARGFWLSRPSLALGAVALVVAVAIAAISLSSNSSSSSTRVYQAQVSGVAGSAQVRVTGGHAVLVVNHLSPPPAGKIYEVWLARPHRAPQPTPALFSVNSGAVDVPGSLKHVDQVLVTPEPAGGSTAPTHVPVISAKLS